MPEFPRQAFTMGARYIGSRCGFHPYHIMAVAEKLSEERGKLPAGSEKHKMWGGGLAMHTKSWVRARASQEYCQAIQPASGRGRPHCAAMTRSDRWWDGG